MTTAALGSIFLISIIIFAIVNGLLWLLELMAAFVKTLVCYLTGKPVNFKRDYIEIRLFFTGILLKLCFAMFSPRQALYWQGVKRHEHEKEKRKRK